MDKLLERFLNYVSLDTQSKAGVRQVPSTEGQWKLLHLLKEQLEEMGLINVTLSEKGTLMATLPANVPGDIPAIGFISHVDTSPDCSGKNVNPQIVENYRGGDIALGIGDEVLSPVMFPVLHQLLGQTLITTDGKTLLGADDKAGIAEIMTALAVLQQKKIPHGDIRVAFTPDEEVGKGAKHFDVDAFDARWAYTVDGGGVGELEFENFNAASVNIKIVGNNVHPGTAKGVMVNALSLAARIHAEVPADESPEMTEGYEGFYHLASMKGTVERADMHYIIRDFDRKQFEARKRKMMEIAKKVGKGLHPDCYIELVIEDSYYNMREKVVEHPHILDIAQQAMRRGMTDLPAHRQNSPQSAQCCWRVHPVPDGAGNRSSHHWHTRRRQCAIRADHPGAPAHHLVSAHRRFHLADKAVPAARYPVHDVTGI